MYKYLYLLLFLSLPCIAMDRSVSHKRNSNASFYLGKNVTTFSLERLQLQREIEDAKLKQEEVREQMKQPESYFSRFFGNN